MPEDFLTLIVTQKRIEIAELRALPETADWEDRARDAASTSKLASERAPNSRDFFSALTKPGRIRLIAEIKRSSPSAGTLRDIPDPVHLAHTYAEAGADAVSVLTDAAFFGGSIDDLKRVRNAVTIPLLRKDFILDPLQIFHAKLAGADAVLLIAECLNEQELTSLVELAYSLDLMPLVELFDGIHLPKVLSSGAKVVGVNNRDLRTFEVDIEHSIRMRGQVPDDRLFIAESGVRSAADVKKMKAAGVNAILVGESLLRAGDPRAAIHELLSEA